MISISEMSALSGVSKRTLQYYDRMGLLRPAAYSQAGYRLYGQEQAERLQQILLYRELEFPLKEIRRILESSDYDRNRALEQQIELLTLKKEHLENLILFAKGLYGVGVKHMDFSAFDTRKIDAYAEHAKKAWGHTPEYREFEEKQKKWNAEEDQALEKRFMALIEQFGQLRHMLAEDQAVQEQVQKIRDFITEHFYTCRLPILAQLGRMYSGGGSMTENIDAAGGAGTAAFMHEAIVQYCAAHAEEESIQPVSKPR